MNPEQLKRIQDNIYDAEALLVYEELGCLREYKRSLREADEVNNPGDAPDKNVSPEERSLRNFFTNFAVNARRVVTAITTEFDNENFFTISFMCKATKMPAPQTNQLTTAYAYDDLDLLNEADAGTVTKNIMKYYSCIFPKLDTKFIKSDIIDPASLKLVTPNNYFSELKLLSKKVDNVLTRYKLKTFGDMGSEIKFKIDDNITNVMVNGTAKIDRNVCKYHVASFENKVTVFDQNKGVGGKIADALGGKGHGSDEQKNDFAINISYFGISGIDTLNNLFGDFFKKNFISSLAKIEIKEKTIKDDNGTDVPGFSFPTLNNFQEDLDIPVYGQKTISPKTADFYNTFNDIFFFYYLTKIKAKNKELDLDYASLEIILSGKGHQSTGIQYKVMVPKQGVTPRTPLNLQDYVTIKSEFVSKKLADEYIEQMRALRTTDRAAYENAISVEDTLRVGNLDDEDMLFIPETHYTNIPAIKAIINTINQELKHDVFVKRYENLLPRCIVVELADKRSLPKALLDKLKRGAMGFLGNFLSGALKKGAEYTNQV